MGFWLVSVYVLVLGLMLGSFYHVVALRTLAGESFVYPPSHCPACRHRLSPADLIPVFSFFLLRGKCKYCRVPISLLYPIGEFITALSFYMVYLRFGWTSELLPAFFLVTVLILAVMTDLREKLILDRLTFPLIAALALTRFFISTHPFMYDLAGALTGFSSLWLVAFVSKGSMGGGDIKLYIAIGIALGPFLTLLSLVFACFYGSVTGILLIASGRVGRRQPIPFAPFIWLGTMTAYLYGYNIWHIYMNLG